MESSLFSPDPNGRIPLSLVADLVDPPAYRDESKVHVSTLVHKAALLTGHGRDSPITPEVEDIMALGRIWEQAVRPHVREAALEEGLWAEFQGVKEKDEVVGSLDGILYDAEKGKILPRAVVEIKSRWSSPGDPRDNWRWMVQSKAYCLMAGVKELWMPVLYLPMRGPPKAEYVLHKLEFLEHELEENWMMLMNVKRSLNDHDR